MACGCRGGQTVTMGAEPAAPPQIEFVVLLPDGSYSEPLPDAQAAFALAAETGGSARSRAKIAA